MFELVSGALSRMNVILHKPELVHDDINPSYNIENEINNYRNQLKSRNIEDINNKLKKPISRWRLLHGHG